jgi:hypothetical protein
VSEDGSETKNGLDHSRFGMRRLKVVLGMERIIS